MMVRERHFLSLFRVDQRARRAPAVLALRELGFAAIAEIPAAATGIRAVLATVPADADAPNKFRLATFGGEHPAQKKQIACLRGFHIGAERLRRRQELDTKLLQARVGVGQAKYLPG